jgi:energy-coupling factor transporter ATP-binding protein EcfA2/energy-coupling factor transporter transmembrane protein EcfT
MVAAPVSFRGWGWQYAGRSSWSVHGIDLDIAAGDRVAIVGASGAGKSTLLRAIAGLLPDDESGLSEGTVLVDGVAPSAARGTVGLVMQDPEAHTVMSRVGDDVAFGPENLGVPTSEIWGRARHALGVVDLPLPVSRSTAHLSGGQRQRLALAGVLAMRPGVLVLDEPCANLDPAGVAQVHDAVRAMLDDTGATLVVVEHRIGTWLDLVDRVVLVEPGGGIVADGSPSDVFAAHGDALTAAGVWVPGASVVPGSARQVPGDRSGGAARLTAAALATTRDRTTTVGSGIDLTIEGGRVIALTGPNGVGKSTLALTLAGLLRPAAGSVRWVPDGTSPIDWTSAELAGRIGTVFQDPAHQFVARSVREELTIGARDAGARLGAARVDAARVDAARVDGVLDVLGLTALADADPFTLSGGEQRRLAIGTVLVSAPPVVVLDEPTSGQDRATWQRIVDRLGALADAGHAVVVITHDADLIAALDADVVSLAPHIDTEPRLADADAAADADALPLPVDGSGARGRGAAPRLLAGVQPVAALLGTLALAACLVTSLDVVSAAVALGLEFIVLPVLRISFRALLLRMVPLLIAAPLAGLSIALYGTPSGATLLDAGFVHVTSGSLVLAIATVLRVLAIGLPAVALFVGSDPTDLADGMAQILRLPARFVLGALAAIRMMALLRDDWRVLSLARRARGLGDRGRIRAGASMAFALLVIALRRASSLSLAMESRGFGSSTRRTWARAARWTWRETLLVVGCAALGLVAVGAAVVTGTWHGR